MKNLFANIFSLSLVILVGCTEIPVGFISDDISYSQNPFYVPQGRVVTSSPIQGDGSTLPLQVKPVEIRNKATGEVVSDLFFEEYTTTVYASAISANDTSYAMVNEKISEELVAVFSIVESGGSLVFSNQSYHIPVGEYTLDVEVANGAGMKVIKDICTIVVHEASPLPDVQGGASAFRTVDDGNGNPVTQEVGFGFTATSEWNEAGENQINFKFVDVDGELIDPIRYGFQEQNLHDGYKFSEATPWSKGAPENISNTVVSYTFPVTPFPYTWIETWRNYGFAFVPIGDAVQEFESKTGYTSFNVRINSYMKFNLPGIYDITIKCDFIDI